MLAHGHAQAMRTSGQSAVQESSWLQCGQAVRVTDYPDGLSSREMLSCSPGESKEMRNKCRKASFTSALERK